MESHLTDPRIVIVGAGPSGLAAGARLLENGLGNISILEAESRIGGRIHTAKLGDFNVDLGAQWVHGEEGNVVFELAQPFGLLDKNEHLEQSFVQEYVDSDGKFLDEEVVKKFSRFHETFLENVESSDEEEDDCNLCESIGNYAEKLFYEVFENNPEIFNEKQKYLHHLELSTISIESTDSWHKLPLNGIDEYVDYPGDQMMNWKDRGYSTALNLLTRSYPDPAQKLPISNKINLNSEVQNIDYSKTHGENSIIVATTDARIFEADHVIVTVPLGVLKERHRNFFIPPLPNNKTRAIEALGYGNVAKVYLLFNKPFWRLETERILRYNFMWKDDHRHKVEKTEKEWTLGVLGAMTVEHKPNILQLWIAGKYAVMMEKQSEDDVLDHSSELLGNFLGQLFKVERPTAILRSCWFTNPHFRGTYTHFTVETTKMKISSKMLEEPLNSSNLALLFAGEATSADRYGTVDGAIRSGWKAADRLLHHYGKVNDVDV
ncbi:hypothetical protein QAD02_017504 [Eretmocerus hayati]|uniref:Uncharacterized protein n=1 Tax=Eretmocerus hayati TaxID=131215 RepID=A0ACC2PEH0_9HYME|nr:hypothetical protein QAD02_017504 [Eretmocerus hayati]